MANRFTKQDCTKCGKKTWHYKEGDKPARCSCEVKTAEVQGIIQGGSMYSRKELPTEAEIRRANRLDRSMWQVAEERRSSQLDVSNEAWAAGLFSDADFPDPNKEHCTFCGAEIKDQVNTLQEKKPRIVVKDIPVKIGDEITIQRKVTSQVETLKACPNCVLNIRKPIVVRTV